MPSNHERVSSERTEREEVGRKDFFPSWPIAVVLNQDDFVSRETLGNVRRHFLIITTSGGVARGKVLLASGQ